MASARLVELSPRCRGEALDGEGEQTEERRGACGGSFLEESARAESQNWRSHQPKGRSSGRGCQVFTGVEAWLHESYLWNLGKSLGLEPEWEEAAAREEGLDCLKSSLSFGPRGSRTCMTLTNDRRPKLEMCVCWGGRIYVNTYKHRIRLYVYMRLFESTLVISNRN